MYEAHEQELEVLESIYGEEYNLIKKGGDGEFASFTINVQPSTDDPDSTIWVGLTLHVQFTASYCDEPAIVTFENVKGLNDEKLNELKSALSETAEENLGCPAIYSIVERCREWLTDNNEKPSDGSAFDEMLRRQREATKSTSTKTILSRDEDPSIVKKQSISAYDESEETRRKRDGTPVTAESFYIWRQAFEAEMEARRLAIEGPDAVKSPTEDKLTGRQLFESKAAGTTQEVEEEGDESFSDDDAGPIDYEVFEEGLDDDDLDDLDDLEDLDISDEED